MKATLLTGFLGSGKTTLLKSILRRNERDIRFGVIVNDLSDLEVDGELIRMGHAVTEEAGTLISLTDGSISDKRLDEFRDALAKLQVSKIDHILIEASGSTNPNSIIKELLASKQITQISVVAMVDAKNLWYDYEGGNILFMKLAANREGGMISSENLLESQLRAASVIALSKTDMLAAHEVDEITKNLAKINPTAVFTTATYGALDTKFLFDAPAYDKVEFANNNLLSEDYDISSEVLKDPRPFHPKRLYDYYREQLGMGVFRSKGFIWLASRPADVLLWNQAGGTIGLELLGTWRSTLLDDSTLLKEEREVLRNQLERLHPLFGDRMNEVTVIGQKRDREIFMKGLQACLCTEAEVARWQRGLAFEDPWPKNIRNLG